MAPIAALLTSMVPLARSQVHFLPVPWSEKDPVMRTSFLAFGLRLVFTSAGDDFLANDLREIVHRVLQPEVANREVANRDEETKSGADKRDY